MNDFSNIAVHLIYLITIVYLLIKVSRLQKNSNNKQLILQETLTNSLNLKKKNSRLQVERDQLVMKLFELHSDRNSKSTAL